MVNRAVVLITCALMLQAYAECSQQPKLGIVRARLEQAISNSEQLPAVPDRLSVLEEIGTNLRSLRAELIRRVLADLFEAITTSPDILPSVPATRAAVSGNDGPPPAKTAVRDDLFRRFTRIVSRYNAELAVAYIKKYRTQHSTSPSSSYLWLAASDTLNDNLAESVRLASVAASQGGFPPEALVYLERLRALAPGSADQVASLAIGRVASLSPNADLALLAYVLALPRVPEIVGDNLLDREIDGRPEATGGATSFRLLGEFFLQLAASANTDPEEQLLVMRVAEERLRDLNLAPSAGIAELDRRVSALLPQDAERRIRAKVAKWVASGDNLNNSIENARSFFETSGEEKYRNRTTLLRALAAAKAGEIDAALNVASALPAESRHAAIDAVLLYAANAAKRETDASAVVTLARSESKSAFVLAHAILTWARIAAKRPHMPNDDLAGRLSELDPLIGQLRSSQERYSVRLGAASLWSLIDSSRAEQELTSLLKDMDAEADADGVPFVNITLPISGTYVEVTVPAGEFSLYAVVRRLSRSDLDQTLAIVAAANRPEIRERCIAAACDAYLSAHKEKRS